MELRKRAVEYLGGKCRLCDYDKCLAAFDFHHTDPMTKDFTISEATSWARAKPELDKCELLCANCHREVHEGYHPGYLDDGYDGGGGMYGEEVYEDELELLD
jgi:predicted HNH restriction endonuclease